MNDNDGECGQDSREVIILSNIDVSDVCCCFSYEACKEHASLFAARDDSLLMCLELSTQTLRD